MTSEVELLLGRHRRTGIILDTNLLLLLIVGGIDESLIRFHRRTHALTTEDFHLLQRSLTGFRTILTTPNVLTELSNLARQVSEPWRSVVQRELSEVIPQMCESFFRSMELVRGKDFQEHGLSDCSILQLARRGRLVMTTDFAEFRMLHEAKCAAINFNELRHEEWE